MKYTYQYKDADNVQHKGKVHASSRDSAFDKVLARGRKPFALQLAPGFGNKLQLHLQRWGAIEAAVLALAVIALALAGILPSRRAPVAHAPATAAPSAAATAPRAQIPDVPDDFEARLAFIFPTSAERFFALHARPGVLCDTGAENLRDLAVAIENDTPVLPDDQAWIAALKRIVAGMKEEAASLVRSGKSIDDIALWLTGRQRMENAYRQQIMDSAMSESLKRKTLKAIGL